MKKLIFAIITLGVLIGLTWFVSDLMNGKIVDYAFFVGLGVTIVIRFFTSSGGFTSNSINLSTQGQTGMKVSGAEGPFTVTQKSFSFLVSLAFTIISLLATVFYYWNEF
ncbi:hypothetical protein V7056_15200 [Bacillus sp. JJ664]